MSQTATVRNEFEDDSIDIPDNIVTKTENLLSSYPMTNQRLVMETAQWWLNNVGNCAIYKWMIHYLDTLENDEILKNLRVYRSAREQAEEIGLEIE